MKRVEPCEKSRTLREEILQQQLESLHHIKKLRAQLEERLVELEEQLLSIS